MNLENRKNILRKISTGLFIISAKDGIQPIAATISFLTQVSIEPPLIAIAIRKDSKLYSTALANKYLAVHLPSKDQKELVASFFKVKEQAKDSVNGYGIKWSELGNPILNDIPMVLEVTISEIINKGDHPIFICEVINTILRKDVDSMTMFDTNWHYGG